MAATRWSKGEMSYRALDARLGGEKQNGGGGSPYLGVGGCGEVVARSHVGKRLWCLPILDKDGVMVLLRSKNELGKL
jgi:hypothetical protein